MQKITTHYPTSSNSNPTQRDHKNFPNMQNNPKKLIQKERIITLQSKKMEFQKHSKPQSRYWTKVEHELFLEALEKFGPKDVKSISAFVGTRTPTQVRTHAQKYFLRLKRGTNERTFLDEHLYKPSNPEISPTRILTDNDLSPNQTTFPNQSNSPPDYPNITTISSFPVSNTIMAHSNNNNINTPEPTNSPEPKTPLGSQTQIISPVIKNNSLPFIRKSEVVKKLVPKYPKVDTESHSIVPRRLTKDDISKLGYAMKVYKHIKDYSTKINCIQRHFFPKTSTEELHLFLTEFFSENPHAIHADFFLLPPSPYPCGNACENLLSSFPNNLYDNQSKEINFEKDLSGGEDRYLDINEKSVSPCSLFLHPDRYKDQLHLEKCEEKNIEEENIHHNLSLSTPKIPKRNK